MKKGKTRARDKAIGLCEAGNARGRSTQEGQHEELRILSLCFRFIVYM